MCKQNYLDPERLSKLQQQISEIATAHGWHDEPKSHEHWCGLIMTEMAKAVEADCNGRRANVKKFKDSISQEVAKGFYKEYGEVWKFLFEENIKDTIEDGFADVVIRLLDMAQEIHGDKINWGGYYPCGGVYHEEKSFIENAWCFVGSVLNWGTMNISDCVSFMFDWAHHLGIDLWQHIEWKMKYNELRPYKHGGKKY